MFYYIIYFFIYSISLLPFSIIYLLSDIFAFLLYYIFRYRKKVVRKNLMRSFPENSLSEIICIEKRFYRFFMQWIFETIKLVSISSDELKKRCNFTYEFQQIFEQGYREKKDMVVLMGHLGNWEWAGAAFSTSFRQPLVVLYHPISNKIFDKMMKKIRTRFGSFLIPMHTALKYILEKQGQNNVFTFIADQCPSPQNAFWLKFLNQETPVYYGPEKIIQKIKAEPVIVLVYPNTRKKTRGYYIIDAKKITPSIHSEYPIMSTFMKELEMAIREHPPYWLWSHNRWKYSKNKT